MTDDPRQMDGEFGRLFRDLEECKKYTGKSEDDRNKCKDLTVRQYYFEPNPMTVSEWHKVGMYLGELDSPVVFVCESPGRFDEGKQRKEVERCFSGTEREEKFHAARKKHGLGNCYITNTVKCGVRKGGRHTDAELEACADFLIRELDLIQPMIIVGVGENAMHTLRTRIAHRLEVPPVLFQVAHYSMRRNVGKEWEREFRELERLLSRLEAGLH